MNYFDHFNYSLANEDSLVEQGLSSEFKTAASICGAGGRAFTLISPNLTTLKVIDISDAQLMYAQFLWETMKQLELPEYLQLFGYQDQALEKRKKILSQLSYSSEVLGFVKAIPDYKLEAGLIYGGRWETYLMKISRWIRMVLQYDFSKLFEGMDLNQQADLYRQEFPHRRLSFLMNIFANPQLMNYFLYKGRMAGEDLVPFLRKNFEQFFTQCPAQNSLFHQLLFLGKIQYSQAYPPYLRTEKYAQIKKYSGEIQFIKKDLTTALSSESAEFWSCSDVLSYFSPDDVTNLERILNQKSGAKRLVFRTFLKHPELSLSSWRARKDLNSSAASQDTTYLYRFQIFDSL